MRGVSFFSCVTGPGETHVVFVGKAADVTGLREAYVSFRRNRKRGPREAYVSFRPCATVPHEAYVSFRRNRNVGIRVFSSEPKARPCATT